MSEKTSFVKRVRSRSSRRRMVVSAAILLFVATISIVGAGYIEGTLAGGITGMASSSPCGTSGNGNAGATGGTGAVGGSVIEGALGGGPEYVQGLKDNGKQTFCDPSAGDYVVETKSELKDALSKASSGEVIYLKESAEIDVTGGGSWGTPAAGTIKSGVTLASNRGCTEGSNGGHVFTEERNELVFAVQDGARVTGVRVSGPSWDWEFEKKGAGRGLDVKGADVEIDNNELWGFPHAAVAGGPKTHVHHNFIHHNARDGLGYGVSYGDNILIEYNHFRNNRHSIASGGRSSYTARFNHIDGESISHIFDMHPEGGKTMKIYRNTFVPVQQVDDDKKTPAVTIRGTPSDIAEIHHNWFYNPEKPADCPSGGWTDEAITNADHGGKYPLSGCWENIEFSNNHYGSSEPSCDIGAPRPGCE